MEADVDFGDLGMLEDARFCALEETEMRNVSARKAFNSSDCSFVSSVRTVGNSASIDGVVPVPTAVVVTVTIEFELSFKVVISPEFCTSPYCRAIAAS